MTETPLLHADLPVPPGRDGGRCAHILDGMDAGVRVPLTPARDFLLSVFDAAPYLGRLAQRRTATLAACATATPDALIDAAIDNLRVAGEAAPDKAALDAALRAAKADAHLVIALADLAGKTGFAIERATIEAVGLCPACATDRIAL